MIRAEDKNWNSATTLYIARRIHEIADGRRIAVMDMGCGEGKILEHLLDYGYDLYGYDLAHRDEALRKKLAPHFGDSFDERIRVTRSERAIPFGDDSFDVVYTNQVFEHVRFLDKMLSECARVLKPGGVLLSNFPIATNPVEGHLMIPFAHWLPPGELRARYLQVYLALGLSKKEGQGRATPEEAVHLSSLDRAHNLDKYLRERTYYRFMNEIASVSKHYFETVDIETGALIRAKIDLLAAGKGTGGARLGALMRLVDGDKFRSCITHFVNAAFCMRNPRKDESPQEARADRALYAG